jgi:hypothetical protein
MQKSKDWTLLANGGPFNLRARMHLKVWIHWQKVLLAKKVPIAYLECGENKFEDIRCSHTACQGCRHCCSSTHCCSTLTPLTDPTTWTKQSAWQLPGPYDCKPMFDFIRILIFGEEGKFNWFLHVLRQLGKLKYHPNFPSC